MWRRTSVPLGLAAVLVLLAAATLLVRHAHWPGPPVPAAPAPLASEQPRQPSQVTRETYERVKKCKTVAEATAILGQWDELEHWPNDPLTAHTSYTPYRMAWKGNGLLIGVITTFPFDDITDTMCVPIEAERRRGGTP
jgi:hypothetical protein